MSAAKDSDTHNTGNRAAQQGVCRDRCEVCHVVITHRPVPSRRRCADQLGQLVLVPLTAITQSSSRPSDRGTR